jgi:cobalt/nickel transport system ATP-binding protein
MTPVLELRHVSYRYPDGTTALRDVSLSLAEGECIGIVGPNGSGKSTLLLHCNGILPERLPDTPAVFVEGAPLGPDNLHHIHRKVGLLFQDPDDQLFSPTVWEDVAFGPIQFGMEPAEVRKRVTDALERVGIPGSGSRSPHHMSGGEKQMVCLAGLLSCDPAVLVLDEPTSSLDPRGRRNIVQLLASLPASKIIASHDLELILQLCSRTLLLDGGEIVASGPTAELFSNEPLMLKHGLEKPHSLQHRHPHT